MDELTTERTFDSQATWVIVFDMLSTDVCTTSHLQTSVRVVQELSVCTVQCRHLKLALNACPIATRLSGQACIVDLTTERSFDLKATIGLRG